MEYGIKSLSTHGIVVKSEQERTFEGYVTVETVDKQGEITVRDELLKTMDIWLRRGGPMSYSHSNKIVGKGLSHESTIYKMPDSGEEKAAIKIKGKVFSDTILDDIVWAGIKNGTLKGLSYGGSTKSPKEAVVQGDGSLAYKLKNLEVYEVAICEHPVNNYALITSFNELAKSYPIENYRKGYDREDGMATYQCNNVICMVEKADKTYNNSNILPHNSDMTDQEITSTETVEKNVANLDAETLQNIISTTVKSTMEALVPVQKEEIQTVHEEESEGQDTEKGYVAQSEFGSLVGVVTDFVQKTNERYETIENLLKDAGSKPTVGEHSPDEEEKSNNEKEILPDEDSTQATQQPTNENSTDEVKIAKGNKEGESLTDVEKAERPNVTGQNVESILGGKNPIIADIEKGMAMKDITQKIRNEEYPGMGDQGGIQIEI